MFSFAPDFFRTWIYLLALKAGMNWIVKDFDRMQSEKSEKVNKASGRNIPHCTFLVSSLLNTFSFEIPADQDNFNTLVIIFKVLNCLKDQN